MTTFKFSNLNQKINGKFQLNFFSCSERKKYFFQDFFIINDNGFFDLKCKNLILCVKKDEIEQTYFIFNKKEVLNLFHIKNISDFLDFSLLQFTDKDLTVWVKENKIKISYL